jgi:hypothetical protein
MKFALRDLHPFLYLFGEEEQTHSNQENEIVHQTMGKTEEVREEIEPQDREHQVEIVLPMFDMIFADKIGL